MLEEESSSNPDGFENLLDEDSTPLNFGSYNPTPTDTVVNPVEQLNLDLIKEEIDSSCSVSEEVKLTGHYSTS